MEAVTLVRRPAYSGTPHCNCGLLCAQQDTQGYGRHWDLFWVCSFRKRVLAADNSQKNAGCFFKQPVYAYE